MQTKPVRQRSEQKVESLVKAPKQIEKSRLKKGVSQVGYDSLAEIVGDWVWEIGNKGIFSYVSPKIKESLGYDQDEVVGKSLNHFMARDEAKRVEKVFKQTAKKNAPLHRFVNTQIHKDGQEVIVETSGVIIFDEKGNPVGWRGVNRDITASKKAENALEESEKKYKLLFDSAINPVCLFDKEGILLLINQNGAKSLGGVPDDFIGKSVFEIFPDSGNPIQEKHLVVFESGEGIEFEIMHQLPTGDTWFWTTIYPAKDSKNNIFAVQVISYDITERKIAEQRITQQAQEIIELSTPVIQVWEGIVIAPLIGMLDSQRTQGFMEHFLNSIVENKSPVALVDITGVPTVDTQTAQHLIEAITAASLLGTKVILTGVRPMIAQTLVHLGVDLSKIETRASLASGLRFSMDILGLKVIES